MPRYRNNEKTHSFRYKSHALPKSVEELQEIVAHATKTGRRIKVSGGNCTFSLIKKTNDILLDLKELLEFRKVHSIDASSRTALVGAGMYLWELIDVFHQKGLHFPVLGGWYGQTLGGAIATSTHGSSFSHGSLSDIVLGVEAVLADGSKKYFDTNHPDMKAWRANLGQLGIVTKVKLKLEEEFFLQCRTEDRDDERQGFQDLFQRISQWHSHETPYVNMLWLPYFGDRGRTITRFLYSQTPSKPNEAALEYEQWAQKKDGNIVKNSTKDRLGAIVAKRFLKKPEGTKDFYSNQVANSFLRDSDVLDRSFRLFCYSQFREPTMNHWMRLVLNVEIALDVAELPAVSEKMSATFREFYQKGIVSNFPRVHFRFTDASDLTLLGTNSGRRTVYVGLYNAAAVLHQRQIPLVLALEKIMDDHDGRPHWGKFRYTGHDEGFKKTYGTNLSEFEACRKKYDPNGTFSDGWDMFKDPDYILRKPFRPLSPLNPKNYGRIHFTGGLSQDL